ncbi:pyruvate dehydrogenase kinase-like protein [Pseudovirgaria hyperparasitica]|uniref:Protein-serine/threonine kinase n=1 Tax=Pseudovirgaria hyperparasitica TaxID=470096 RepID=A0A6A6WIW2_9PEZI|nr:pyruvate dehydrogenase kinase-like protein [Pseudovirgaria hyperparasitica]KAF2762105.1 pyruvate dehydrogenase kinase-like protein [Pseudovirgaria hyperparasitica]
MSWKKSRELMETIKHYSNFPATGVSLRQMVQFGERPSTGTLFRASQFLSEELPIRLAHRVQELNDLPDGLNDMPSIQRVQDWYAQSFEELTTLPRPSLTTEVRDRLLKPAKKNARDTRMLSQTTQNPSVKQGQYKSAPATNGNGNGHGKQVTAARRYYVAADDGEDWPPELSQYNSNFAAALDTIKRRHDSVVTTVAQGILEYKRKRQRMQIDHNIQAFLDRFYMSRIGIRMLIGQHIALTDQKKRTDSDYVGIICTKTNVKDLAMEAIENARFVCEDHYGLFDAPKVQLICNPDINFMYVPGHLSHMLFETLKNSLRAVVETHGQDKEEFPVTKVIVAEGKEDITIKISDEGGGIPRSSIPLVWTYMYTTVDQTPNLDPDFNKSDFKAPMAGFGYGLPISRLYARYFGGDLKLISMEGYGTDQLPVLRSSSSPSNGWTEAERIRDQLKRGGTLAARAMKLKLNAHKWEVSERRQVGDAESMVNRTKDDDRGAWWRNVGMEEGM